MSLRKSIFSPRACSGLMYSGVPMTRPVAVAEAAAPPQLLRDPEVHQPDLAARVAHDVRRLQVAVDDADVVDRGEAVRDLQRGRERLVRGQPAALADHLAQVDALHVLHRDVAQALVLAVLVDAADVPVADAAGELDLRLEAPRDLRVARHLGPQHLDRHLLVEQPVVRAVDDAHAALAELRLDLVAAGDHGAEAQRRGESAAAGEAGLRGVVVRRPGRTGRRGSWLAKRTRISRTAGPLQPGRRGRQRPLRPGSRGVIDFARPTRSFATCFARREASR